MVDVGLIVRESFILRCAMETHRLRERSQDRAALIHIVYRQRRDSKLPTCYQRGIRLWAKKAYFRAVIALNANADPTGRVRILGHDLAMVKDGKNTERIGRYALVQFLTGR